MASSFGGFFGCIINLVTHLQPAFLQVSDGFQELFSVQCQHARGQCGNHLLKKYFDVGDDALGEAEVEQKMIGVIDL